MQSVSKILYFSNDWAAENRTSSHHIARRLAEKHEVYYIECPGMRAPRGTRRDLKRVFEKLFRTLRPPKQALPGLKVTTLFQLPFHRFAVVRWLNRLLIYLAVRRLMWREGIRQPIAWFVAPHVASLIGRLGEAASVYYVTDDHASMPDVDVEAVRAMDERLTRRADVVFVASDTLLEAKSALNPNTHYSPHGVDVEHFGQASDPDGPLPEDIRNLPRPIVGFFGLVERWLDLDLLEYLARQRPEWTFLMIGRVAVSQEQIPQLPNVRFIGKRPYDELPAYGRCFTAAILPFRLTPEAWHANPLKLLEYLAMNRPVVSVDIPAARKLEDVLEVAATPEEFLARLDHVIREPATAEELSRRAARVAASSWDARVATVLGEVDKVIAAKNCAAAPLRAVPAIADPGQAK